MNLNQKQNFENLERLAMAMDADRKNLEACDNGALQNAVAVAKLASVRFALMLRGYELMVQKV